MTGVFIAFGVTGTKATNLRRPDESSRQIFGGRKGEISRLQPTPVLAATCGSDPAEIGAPYTFTNYPNQEFLERWVH